MARAGRRSKLDDVIRDAIIRALSIGATYKDAAEAAGVHYDTFNRWMKMGEEAKSGKFHDFYESVRRVEAETRNRYLAVIAKAAHEGDWRAALEYLKRRDRANWGDNVDVTSGYQPLDIKIIWRTYDDSSGDSAPPEQT
jgi:hypothetical protein